jgi:hypothetical protein
VTSDHRVAGSSPAGCESNHLKFLRDDSYCAQFGRRIEQYLAATDDISRMFIVTEVHEYLHRVGLIDAEHRKFVEQFIARVKAKGTPQKFVIFPGGGKKQA